MLCARTAASVTAITIVLLLRTAHAQDAKACAAAFDQAQQGRDDGRYQRAREQFLVCARAACPREVRQDCVQGLSDLERSAPSVVISAKDAEGRDLSSVRVFIDGQPTLSALDGKPTLVDPGPHTFRYEAAGWPAREEAVIIRAGEKNRILEARFAAPPPPPRAPSRPPTLAWVFAGTAALAFTNEAVFGVWGIEEQHNLQASPCAATRTCDVGPLWVKYAIADASLGVGVVSAGLAAYFFLARRSPPGPRTQGFNFGAQILDGGALGTVGGRF
jgi:hypothetical protein